MFKKKKMFVVFPETGESICKQDVDDILYTAFNAGGISKWADKILASERKFGTRVYEHIGLGGTVLIHDCKDDRYHLFDGEKLMKGIRLYIEDGMESISQGHLVKFVDVNDADAIVQLGLFEEVRYQ